MAERRRVLVALVVPGEAALEIDGLRRALSSPEVNRIAPHVTLVPPRNLASARSGELSAHLHEVAARYPPIALSLGPPSSFVHPRPVLYLSVKALPDVLDGLVGDLAAGPLAPPEGREPREFVAHVTLSSGLAAERVHVATSLLEGYRREVPLDSLVLLEQDPSADSRPWVAVEDVRLGRPALTGRGGRELTFHLAHHLPAHLAEQLRPAALAGAGHLVMVVEELGAPIAYATALEGAEALVVEELEVVPAARGSGVGGQLLAFVEKVATERGLHEVAVGDLRSIGFLLRHGYRSGPLGLYHRSW